MYVCESERRRGAGGKKDRERNSELTHLLLIRYCAGSSLPLATFLAVALLSLVREETIQLL